MSHLRAIAKGAFAIPVTILILGTVSGVLLLLLNITLGIKIYESVFDILGLLIFWVVITFLMGTISAVVIGWPTIVIADKYNILSKRIVLSSSCLLGGVFLALAYVAVIGSIEIPVILFAFFWGSFAGLYTGSVTWKYINLTRSTNRQTIK